ncbi:MAG: DUF3078 domain-containing protein, partial [Duncaniella sp.]|nr:DUF3078 domain-containing protein [Duncaniella sp.]
MKTAGLTLLLLAALPLIGHADITTLEFRPAYQRSVIYDIPVFIPSDTLAVDSLTLDEAVGMPEIEVLDAFFEGEPMEPVLTDTITEIFFDEEHPSPLRPTYLRPVVFGGVQMFDGPMSMQPLVTTPGAEWLDNDQVAYELIRRTRQNYILNNPEKIEYIEWLLPQPPKKFTATIDPEHARIIITETPELPLPNDLIETTFERRHWLKTFNANLQFSQAFVSPNWYQGGNNNLNALASLYYDVKLNP